MREIFKHNPNGLLFHSDGGVSSGLGGGYITPDTSLGPGSFSLSLEGGTIEPDTEMDGGSLGAQFLGGYIPGSSAVGEGQLGLSLTGAHIAESSVPAGSLGLSLLGAHIATTSVVTGGTLLETPSLTGAHIAAASVASGGSLLASLTGAAIASTLELFGGTLEDSPSFPQFTQESSATDGTTDPWPAYGWLDFLSANEGQAVPDGKTVTIGTKVYTFIAGESLGSAVDGDVVIGGDSVESFKNLYDAINVSSVYGGGAGVQYAATMTPHPLVHSYDLSTTGYLDDPEGDGSYIGWFEPTLLIEADTPGSGGNSIVTSEDIVNAEWRDATMIGGSDGDATLHRVFYTGSAGDLVVICFGTDGNLDGDPTGWTQLDLFGSGNGILFIYARILDGTETTGFVDFTTVSGAISRAQAFTIADGTYGSGTLEQIVSVEMDAFGGSSNPNPPSLTPDHGSLEYLWIAAALADLTVGSFSSPPTNYEGMVEQTAATFKMATATRQLEAATDDPSAFITSGDEPWAAATIAIAPVTYAAPTVAPEFSGVTSRNWSAKDFEDDADTTAIPTWTDRHEGLDAVQATGVSQPTKITDTSLPVVNFDGTNDRLTCAAATFGSAATYFFVAKFDSGAAAGALLDGLASTARNVVYNLSSNNFALYAGINCATGTDPRGMWGLWRVVVNGASSEIYLDGVLDGSGNAGAQVLSAGISFGSYYNATNFFNGQLAEAAMYDALLDSSQTAEVEAWLASEWAGLL